MKARRWGEIAEAVVARVAGHVSPGLMGYTTRGGTYILAITREYADDGRPHDLVAVLPGMVVALRPTVNPELVEAIQAQMEVAP